MASKILWYAAPNLNTTKGGFLPLIEVDGKERGDTYSGITYDRDVAEEMARVRALEIANRFGDEDTVVAPKHAVFAKITKARRTRGKRS